MVTARRAAVKALGAWRREGAWSGAYLDQRIKSGQLAGREAAFAQRLTLGVLQNLYLCDFVLQAFSSQKLRKLEPTVLDILRVGTYQILFLDRVPDFSAVDESVELTKKLANPRAAGFVNAVLRKVAAEGRKLPLPAGNGEEALHIRYSFPLWLIRCFSQRLGPAACEDLLLRMNLQPQVCLQVNTLRSTPEALCEQLGAVPSGVFPSAVFLDNAAGLEKLAAFQAGDFFVQDISARCAVEAADPKPGQRVLDLCAAPGGKSFMAAVRMEGKGEIRAFDLHEKKIPRIEAGAQRLGFACIRAAQGDASQYRQELDSWADLVLADVPCSGLGIIRKKPEIRYKPEESIQQLPALQLTILRNAARYVRPGGCLLYSTCTLLAEENEDVVKSFLQKNAAFQPEDFSLPQPYGDSKDGQMTIWPQRCGSDGFFIAKLRRNDEK